MTLSCRIRELREKVESGINKRKGKTVRIKPPSDIPSDVWMEAHGEGVILEDVYVAYRSRVNPQVIWEVSLQVVALKDGCVGLRVVHFKRGKMVRVPMINYIWVLEDLKQEIGKTILIKNILREIAA